MFCWTVVLTDTTSLGAAERGIVIVLTTVFLKCEANGRQEEPGKRIGTELTILSPQTSEFCVLDSGVERDP